MGIKEDILKPAEDRERIRRTALKVADWIYKLLKRIGYYGHRRYFVYL